MAGVGKIQPVRSSLPYHMLLYINGWYFGFFLIVETLLYIFKGQTLPYPVGAFPAELSLLYMSGILEYLRLFFGKKGNLTERVLAVGWSIVLSVPALLCAVYLLVWQTYVLQVEVILIALQMLFISLELLFAIISCITFASVTVSVLFCVNRYYGQRNKELAPFETGSYIKLRATPF